ncbi:bll1951 [Bradyrhizobium diazoefficiens USDA 110]|uniref:Bll1951 protein n=4 Tax=Bradyrhizobium TaxID=374 RepID=Q89TJ0_BRADU|nr:hypothetical protein CO678_39960 [Bradyrhizobium diazoefficiens]QBP20802.1 hypothetical protein Bdiaspc4_09915 [Bradyrhizobium diazoefficiens]BAC47216.1 bll1951 [Bradyrhizobium diazoefficiens USDA 110]
MSFMTLSEHLPADIREVMDAYVGDLRPQPWRIRFLLLIDLLQEKLESGPAAEYRRLLQQWTGIVTAILEHLPPDSSVVECLGLMSISFNDQWRAQALGQIERDPTVLDQLVAICPDWEDIVDTVLEANQRRPIKAGQTRAR